MLRGQIPMVFLLIHAEHAEASHPLTSHLARMPDHQYGVKIMISHLMPPESAAEYVFIHHRLSANHLFASSHSFASLNSLPAFCVPL